MSNHAYESAAALRPRHCAPTALADLAHTLSLEVAGDPAADLDQVLIHGVSVDSGDVAPGELFVALPGFRRHGAEFAAQAVAGGAVAVLTDADGAARLGASLGQVPVLTHPDPRAVVGPLAAEVYHHPATHLTTTAVTGTNGKTTTTYFLQSILAAHLGQCMIAGTVELSVGTQSVESPRTTVEAPVLQRMMALAVEEGVKAASLEASSHAIVLHRLGGTVVDVAGFTNLQRDHLDFHHTMEEYLEAKARLFTPEHARRAVICVDDRWGAALAERVADRGAVPVDRVRAYPAQDSEDPAQGAQWWVSQAKASMTQAATTFTLHGPDGEQIEALCPLPGLVNVQNAALALVMALRAGVAQDTAVQALAHAHNIPGRMQRISQRDGRRGTCIVDFAHTPEAMDLALKAVREITPGRLIVVFGSDGDRDQGKRPLLGQVAARLADVLVVTDENPRSEDPQLIRDAVLAGVRSVRPGLEDVEEITTWRGDAVRRGVELCGPQDTVIVTGKGHEPFLEMAGEFIRYNDAPVMREAVEAKWPARTGAEASTGSEHE
ncbi:MAG: UDP-N-acetylmuramoyl-L-alanyl-D-glutamate--2,6-diaminopimelate ligase [Actinomyces urogenitalis]|uniref:UDP-N-acetylmuramyl-tripeptide synthetase n=2 Tax=root TaxID=1 RepID=A0A2I1KTL5_9ACTO|nr:UDP-N-acetylmuramoyl-L-alanyl-D-glutamate--2,6-diaminopimelate ligase [Actinomyces urogenitalis]MDU0971818.1 UDP-N-acetylmuramoyl-L-alanyl-D-glutamate--2,6-diaminopimelate ligase [Actinomyces urogenitalis]PKY98973.1 UDP-N-acetylmuramoyl-L-alanyl-D-glutamate--2,6-diaminopimelate ligase [Actinomyces urogenitalis]